MLKNIFNGILKLKFHYTFFCQIIFCIVYYFIVSIKVVMFRFGARVKGSKIHL